VATVTALPRATDYVLAVGDASRLEDLLIVEHTRVRTAVANEDFDGPVCALALLYVGQEDIPVAFETYALTERERDTALARDGEQGLWRLWSPADWGHAEFVVWPSDDRVVEDARCIAAALRQAGCDNPEGAVACELAYRLAHADWSDVMVVSQDFACWASHHDVTEETLKNFRASVTATTLAAYELRRWLRLPGEFAPRP
jgi:hypothetical protein